jgi:hypothetical protein
LGTVVFIAVLGVVAVLVVVVVVIDAVLGPSNMNVNFSLIITRKALQKWKLL